MNSAVDLSTNSATISPQTRAEEARSQSTAYLWIGLAFFMIGGVTGSYYMNMMNIIDAPYVGP
jgi:hypothetical protein